MKARKLLIVFSVMFALFGNMNHCYAYEAEELLYDMDLPGNNFRTFPLEVDDEFNNIWDTSSRDFRENILIPAANECKNDCDHDSRCLAWTYKFYGYRQIRVIRSPHLFLIRVRGECFLKDGVPSVAPRPMHISGVKPAPSRSNVKKASISSTVSKTTLPQMMRAKEYDTKRPGGDYRKFSMNNNDPDKCQIACMKDIKCKAWTYAKPKIPGEKAQCLLKNSVPKKIHNSCCISGVK